MSREISARGLTRDVAGGSAKDITCESREVRKKDSAIHFTDAFAQSCAGDFAINFTKDFAGGFLAGVPARNRKGPPSRFREGPRRGFHRDYGEDYIDYGE